MRPGAVFDCMVFVQAIASKGTAYRCYQHVTSTGTPLLTSPETLAELRAVLNRPELRQKLPGITSDRVEALMHHLAELAFVIDPVHPHLSFPADPKDEPYINLAIEGQAASLVTRDRAILRLASPADPLFRAIRALNPALQVVEPERFLLP